MGLGLFLIPALAGYWFLTHLYFTRYSVLRDSGYHVFFRSTIAGGILFVVAYPLSLFLSHYLPQIAAIWKSYVPVSYSGTVMLSALLGFMGPIVCNWFYGKEKAARRVAIESGDLVELLIAESIEKQMLVEFSLKSGKSYIGLALESEPPKHGKSDIALIPMASGYRNKDTHKLEITTHYAPEIKKSLESRSDLDYESLLIVIPMSEIVSARFFHPEVYKSFQKEELFEEQEDTRGENK